MASTAAELRRSDPVINYLVRRLIALAPVALGVVTLTFAIIHLVPGDPVVAMLGETAAPADTTRAEMSAASSSATCSELDRRQAQPVPWSS